MTLATHSGVIGHAVISWFADDTKLTKALLVDKWHKGTMGSGLGYAVSSPLNNGQPF
ncbi:hypothetical protein [Maridesulfovibrio sp. FT414]|uniref:hypothetical protein n=1 Tax=Maridesulfovibrio sp. FT414 TaxID=2979469 RepID=UPI003D805B8E